MVANRKGVLGPIKADKQQNCEPHSPLKSPNRDPRFTPFWGARLPTGRPRLLILTTTPGFAPFPRSRRI
jgi:hypothetical protein